jgi:hypothetical protein
MLKKHASKIYVFDELAHILIRIIMVRQLKILLMKSAVSIFHLLLLIIFIWDNNTIRIWVFELS